MNKIKWLLFLLLNGVFVGTASAYWAENRPAAGTAHSLPVRLFPTDNWWNLNISAAPVDPGSAAYIADLAAAHLSYDWGNNYGLPYTTVSGDYPKVSFQGCNYWSESDHISYPIPIPALTEPGWTEDLTGTINNPVSTGDRHLLIVDTDNQYLYEIYQPLHNATASPIDMGGGNILQPGNYWCASAAFWDMKTNNTRPDGWTSSDAAGLQVLPGLVQYDEVTGNGPITHAHRVTLNFSASVPPLYVWPATHYAGNYSPTHPPLGARFRLKANRDISGFGPNAQRLLQSMKTYGIIFADNGPNGMVTGTNDARWGDYDSPIRTEFAVAMSALTFNDFEVIQLGWKPQTRQSPVGNAVFSNPNSPNTDVVFDSTGTWFLQLSVTDGFMVQNATVTVTVNAAVVKPRITGGTTSVIAGNAFTIPVSIATGTTGVAGLQFDIPLPVGISTGPVVAGSAAIAAGKGVQANVVGGALRVLVTGANQNIIGSGPVALVTFQTAPSIGTQGFLPLPFANVVATGANGNNVPLQASVSGSVTITANQAPVVIMGPSQTITQPASASLTATATDDGAPNPPGALAYSWSVL